MKKWLAIPFLCLLVSGTAFACVDPDPDQMGVYFDSGAQTYCIPAYMGKCINVYLVYTRPTLAQYQGFECGLTIEGTAFWTWIWPGLWIVPPEMDNIIFCRSEPCPTTTATVLMCAQLIYLDPAMGPVYFYLHGASDYSTGDPALPGILYPEGETLATLPVGVSGGPGLVTAQINGECLVVDTETATWGSIKALFR